MADLNRMITLKIPDTRKWWQKLLHRKNRGILYQGQAVYIGADPATIGHDRPPTIIGIATGDSYRDENGHLVGTVLIQGGFSSKAKD